MPNHKISDGTALARRVVIVAEDHPFVDAEGIVEELLVNVDGIDVRVPADAVRYLNEGECVESVDSVLAAA